MADNEFPKINSLLNFTKLIQSIENKQDIFRTPTRHVQWNVLKMSQSQCAQTCICYLLSKTYLIHIPILIK